MPSARTAPSPSSPALLGRPRPSAWSPGTCCSAPAPEIQKSKNLARRHSQMIIDENQKVHSELDCKMQDLELKSKKLDELAVRSESDRRNLEKEKEKNMIKAKYLKMATLEQQKTDENVLKLVEKHKLTGAEQFFLTNKSRAATPVH
nr:factor of DNA methylation 1 isoform X2 [Aegilops tauschii subsp. strangulata]